MKLLYKCMQTYDNDDDCNGNTYRASYHAFSNECPFYRLLYFDFLDLATVEDNVGNGNMALPNVGLSSDTLTSPRPLLNNCIRLRHIHTYRRKDIIVRISLIFYLLQLQIIYRVPFMFRYKLWYTIILVSFFNNFFWFCAHTTVLVRATR